VEAVSSVPCWKVEEAGTVMGRPTYMMGEVFSRYSRHCVVDTASWPGSEVNVTWRSMLASDDSALDIF
jgi:hypothetical protein